ncbi:MAG TPA: carboxypeptidase regulatory-like domain-containing protein [Candidatus Binatia bacterium]|nr:carboxypeptidase regulatory-like domain-containing protein [Candidatus Binatia bacterium]
MSRKCTAIALALAWSFAGSLATAAPPADEPQGGGVPYLTGGVGTDEREALQERAAGYNLLVEVAAPSGAYQGGGRVAVRDGSGKTVLATNMDGPQLYAKLPPGHYTVAFEGSGSKPKTASVQVPASGRAKTVIDVSTP